MVQTLESTKGEDFVSQALEYQIGPFRVFELQRRIHQDLINREHVEDFSLIAIVKGKRCARELPQVSCHFASVSKLEAQQLEEEVLGPQSWYVHGNNFIFHLNF